tara:strand:- start:123680 stop:124762 length:1083 start_codon:yes stop_codon:yes gene_type:complete
MAAQQTFSFLDESPSIDPPVSSRTRVPPPNIQPANIQPASRKQVVRRSPSGKQVGEKPVSLLAGTGLPNATLPSNTTDDRTSVLQQLRRQAGCISTAPADDTPVLSTGSAQIDRYLPHGGLRIDAFHEWVSASDSSGAAVLGMIAAATYLNSHDHHLPACGPLVVVDREGTFYPPAAVALGIPAPKIVLVRPQNHADHVWAIDQALRCESVAAVWSHIGGQLGDRDARRFQLAAEQGRTPGFLIRPAAVRGRPTFADVRLHVEQTRVLSDQNSLQLQVTIDRCRGGTTGRMVQVQVDDHGRMQPIELPQTFDYPITAGQPRHQETLHHETATMHLASRLAHPTTAQSRTDTRNDSRRRRA